MGRFYYRNRFFLFCLIIAALTGRAHQRELQEERRGTVITGGNEKQQQLPGPGHPTSGNTPLLRDPSLDYGVPILALAVPKEPGDGENRDITEHGRSRNLASWKRPYHRAPKKKDAPFKKLQDDEDPIITRKLCQPGFNLTKMGDMCEKRELKPPMTRCPSGSSEVESEGPCFFFSSAAKKCPPGYSKQDDLWCSTILAVPPQFKCTRPFSEYIKLGHQCKSVVPKHLLCPKNFVLAPDQSECLILTPLSKECTDGYFINGDRCSKRIIEKPSQTCPKYSSWDDIHQTCLEVNHLDRDCPKGFTENRDAPTGNPIIRGPGAEDCFKYVYPVPSQCPKGSYELPPPPKSESKDYEPHQPGHCKVKVREEPPILKCKGTTKMTQIPVLEGSGVHGSEQSACVRYAEAELGCPEGWRFKGGQCEKVEKAELRCPDGFYKFERKSMSQCRQRKTVSPILTCPKGFQPFHAPAYNESASTKKKPRAVGIGELSVECVKTEVQPVLRVCDPESARTRGSLRQRSNTCSESKKTTPRYTCPNKDFELDWGHATEARSNVPICVDRASLGRRKLQEHKPTSCAVGAVKDDVLGTCSSTSLRRKLEGFTDASAVAKAVYVPKAFDPGAPRVVAVPECPKDTILIDGMCHLIDLTAHCQGLEGFALDEEKQLCVKRELAPGELECPSNAVKEGQTCVIYVEVEAEATCPEGAAPYLLPGQELLGHASGGASSPKYCLTAVPPKALPRKPIYTLPELTCSEVHMTLHEGKCVVFNTFERQWECPKGTFRINEDLWYVLQRPPLAKIEADPLSGFGEEGVTCVQFSDFRRTSHELVSVAPKYSCPPGLTLQMPPRTSDASTLSGGSGARKMTTTTTTTRPPPGGFIGDGPFCETTRHRNLTYVCPTEAGYIRAGDHCKRSTPTLSQMPRETLYPAVPTCPKGYEYSESAKQCLTSRTEKMILTCPEGYKEYDLKGQGGPECVKAIERESYCAEEGAMDERAGMCWELLLEPPTLVHVSWDCSADLVC